MIPQCTYWYLEIKAKIESKTSSNQNHYYINKSDGYSSTTIWWIDFHLISLWYLHDYIYAPPPKLFCRQLNKRMSISPALLEDLLNRITEWKTCMWFTCTWYFLKVEILLNTALNLKSLFFFISIQQVHVYGCHSKCTRTSQEK